MVFPHIVLAKDLSEFSWCSTRAYRCLPNSCLTPPFSRAADGPERPSLTRINISALCDLMMIVEGKHQSVEENMSAVLG